ncbi:MAG: hypothetical protein LBS19_02750 [Clostridiales bacterium]|jgi:hypothetical protein|nr:hypothetical protein [Clostridiales bacterium]
MLSSAALNIYLSEIKTMFQDYDYNRLKKMIFMNIDSFLGFIDMGIERGPSGKTFKEVIEMIEPFIPLVINDESLDTYLLAAISQDENELIRLQNQFVQNAKIRFVKNLMGAQSEDDMEEIFEVCRTIREYKAKSVSV